MRCRPQIRSIQIQIQLSQSARSLPLEKSSSNLLKRLELAPTPLYSPPCPCPNPSLSLLAQVLSVIPAPRCLPQPSFPISGAWYIRPFTLTRSHAAGCSDLMQCVRFNVCKSSLNLSFPSLPCVSVTKGGDPVDRRRGQTVAIQ